VGIKRPAWLLEKQLKLGSDLKGGVHLVLGVQIPSGYARAGTGDDF